jgi:predicted NBD/HSP70 family sugar kinase
MASHLGRNSKLIKIHNRALVIRKIIQNPMISRKEIAGQTELTQAAITKIVNFLIGKCLVAEQETDNKQRTTGRQPIGLSLDTIYYRIIAVELGRCEITVAILDLSGKIICRNNSMSSISGTNINSLPEIIITLIRTLMEENCVDNNQVLGVGISAPGPINNKDGVILEGLDSPDFNTGKRYEAPYDWRKFPLTEYLEQEFNVPVFADNSGNISALAESWFGAGKGIQNFVQYSVGLGIGAGVIIDGLLYRGEDDVVSEIGHITVDMNGPVCTCGNIGCLELYCNFKNILSSYYTKKKLPPRNPDEISNREIVNELQVIWKKAHSGEDEAVCVISELSDILGIGAVSLTNIFSPEFIIVSTNDVGEVDSELLIEPIREYVKKHAFSVIADKVKIISSALGKDIHIIGSGALVLQELFSYGKYFSSSKE